jgi:uncharacterized protein with FMN-binding domain
MRRITVWALSTLTTLVLLFSYHTSTSSRTSANAPAALTQAGAAQANGSGSGGSAGSSGSGAAGDGEGSDGSNGNGGGSSTTPTPAPSTSSPSTPSSGTKTYDGDAVSTRFGNVQVRITVQSGQITNAEVLQVPWNDRRDQEINSYAVPVLNGEVVTAQSATIDMVSGATFTSEGYIQSLQSAIDRAHL